MTYKEIENKNLSDLKDEKHIVALHETGHLIAMMALGMYDKFKYITLEPGNGNKGLTELNKQEIEQFGDSLVEKAVVSHQSPDNYIAYCLASFSDAPRNFLPHIIRLFAGGSICRHYGRQRDDLCKADNANIMALLLYFNLGTKFNEIESIADAFLKLVFERYDKAAKLICYNLIERKTLNKKDVDELLEQNKNDIFKW